ncbi:MAG: hypothetical protein R6X32_20865 [Chloroflexota bacterium]
MKRKIVAVSVIFLLCLLFIPTEQTMAQSKAEVILTIQLRYSDGTAVIDEPVILQRLPEEEPISPRCITNGNGECTWTVGRGLYQVLFERPLDNISALAVAEGGLRGLGITVGDENITYHFTFHSDGRVYFDAAPEAAIPSPIIPVGDVLHGGIVLSPTPSSSPQPKQPVDVTATRSPNPAALEDTAANTTSGSSWRLILFIGGGLVIGGGLHLLGRRSGQARTRKRRHADDKTNRLSDQETDHA